MRLSEALMLGSTLGLQINAMDYNRCFLGISHHAIADRERFGKAEHLVRWPWLGQPISHPYFAYCKRPQILGHSAVSILCFDVVWHNKITLEQAIDIIREMEPAEPETSTLTEGSRDAVEVKG